MTALSVHPDRLLPADGATRDIARSIYKAVADAPIVSPHGHVPAHWLSENRPFSDPASLLVTPDHYVTRILHGAGVALDRLGVGTPDADPREIWRLFCSNWHLYLGTPVRYWFENELAGVFGITEHPSAANADDLYDTIAEHLAGPDFTPRALFERFGIEVLATTDDPADDLAAHRAIADDARFPGRVLPTMRADVYMTPAKDTWLPAIERLSDASGIDCGTYAGLLDALRARRSFFRAHGSTAIDCGVDDAWATPLDDVDAERIHRDGMKGTVSELDSIAYRRNMLYRFAAMSSEDGLVMQLHAGVVRNHHAPTFHRFGPDSGHDLPAHASFVLPLQRLLHDFGTHPRFRLVLFTVDETAFSREIAPLAGFYPSVFIGAPWWFLDAPAAIARFRAATTETAGFYKGSGFIDDTRAFCSIPARHDMSRRLDAGYLAGLVASHQLSEDDAHTIARDLVSSIPRNAFRLDD